MKFIPREFCTFIWNNLWLFYHKVLMLIFKPLKILLGIGISFYFLKNILPDKYKDDKELTNLTRYWDNKKYSGENILYYRIRRRLFEPIFSHIFNVARLSQIEVIFECFRFKHNSDPFSRTTKKAVNIPNVRMLSRRRYNRATFPAPLLKGGLYCFTP